MIFSVWRQRQVSILYLEKKKDFGRQDMTITLKVTHKVDIGGKMNEIEGFLVRLEVLCGRPLFGA